MTRKHLPRVLSVVLLTVIPAVSIYASENTDDVRFWLNKMSGAMSSKSYEGTFVYQGFNEMVAMNIVHTIDEHGERERLISLNGEQGEVIRDHQGVTCKFPHVRPVVLDKRGFSQVFPVSMIDVLDAGSNLYAVSIRRGHQVAGRVTRILTIRPRDKYRYGYRLWIDEKTGLLLKSQLIDSAGKILEQLMYTSIDIYDTAPDTLRQAIPSKMVTTRRDPDMTAAETVSMPKNDHTWQVKHLPEGFALAEHHNVTPSRKRNFEHLVYTDGLASVSVFIEKSDNKPSFLGESHMGAITAYGSMINEHQVTVVGEVPLETLRIMSGSVKYSAAGLH